MVDHISTRKSQLSATKRALLAKRLKGNLKSSSPKIPCREPGTIVPLSFSQQRLWFLYQFAPDSPFYNVPFALHLKGKLDIAALKQTLQTLLQRHEILRTTVADAKIEGQAQQIIHAQATPQLKQRDLSNLGEQAWAEVKRLAQEESHQPFDLYQGPLLRVTLLAVAEHEFILLVTLHHIISDVWSTGILVGEMVTLYRAFIQAKPAPLPPLPIQYADFTLWQRQWLQGEKLQKQIRYWQHQFATLPSVLQLPTDRPRPAVQSFCGDRKTFSLSSELTQGLKDLGQKTDATLFMTVLAAFKVLLYRYTGQTDITIGSPIANRNQAAIEGLIGLFMNTLALRTQLDGNPSFRELLIRVREVALGAYSHQDLPFEKLIDLLSLPRDLSHTPLFQVMVVLQNAPSASLDLPGLTLSLLDLPNNTSKFDLTLILAEVDDCLQGVIEYSTDLFDRTTIDRLLGHFQVLLAGIVTDADTRLSDLPLLTPDEVSQLHQWHQPQVKPLTSICLHELFEAQVAKSPEAIAITFKQQPLTYAELNQRANQLAHYLQTEGVGPETLVGLCVERSLEMVIGLLGILKAGGAYVPMDPDYPRARLQFMVEDTQVSVLLTQEKLLENLPEADAHIFCLDSEWSTLAQTSAENLQVVGAADNLAYVIYTSGSTGRPKGVMVSHQAIVNHMQWVQSDFPLNTTDKFLQKTPFSFDASIWEFYAPLLVGAQLVLAEPGGHQDSDYLIATIVEQQITHLQLVPSLLRTLLAQGDFSRCRTLRQVFCGGEVLSRDLQEQFFAQLDASLHNLYGPTEACINTTHWTCQSSETLKTVPIGHPVANVQTYILDPNSQLVPIGVPGELQIGGAGLARGYLNRSNLTAEKFVANPFVAGRLYKTGDLVRYRCDGAIEYLGRIDHQVKLRGFRIELGEVEAVFLQHVQIGAAIAIVREDKPGQKQLVAYLTPQNSTGAEAASTISVGDLRQWLQSQLPDYMIPSAFVWLEQMPLTPNGKVDRRALPVPSLDYARLAVPFTAPRSQLEQQLATVWSNVLDSPIIGIDDNFFELGGDSILSLQIIAQAKQAGLQLTLKQLFQHQTIRTLATVVERIKVISAEQGPVTGAVPLTPIQHWFFDQLPCRHHCWYQALCLQLHQPLNLEDMQAIIHQLLNHHDALRLSFRQQGAGWGQDNRSPMAADPASAVVTTTLSEGSINRAIASAVVDFQTNLDLTVGPLLRAVLIDSTAPEHPQYLLLIAHQLVIDEASWSILTKDLQTLLHQRLQAQPLQLPPKTTSFQQWAQRLHTYSQTLESEPWSSPKTQSPLAIDFPNGENTLASNHTVTVHLAAEDTQHLLQQVPLAYHTQTHEVLLTALVQTYAHWAGESQLTVDFASNGRHHAFEDIDLSRTVGWFMTLYPIALDLTNIDSPGPALKAVKEQLRCVPHQGLDYGVYRYLKQTEEMAETLLSWPALDIYFSYSESFKPDSEVNIPQIKVVESPEFLRRLQYQQSHKLYLDSRITAGQLRLSWTYNQSLHAQSTIETLAATFLEKLQGLIDHCLSPEAGGYTPSDFPLAQLDQATLDQLVVRYPNIEDCYPLTPIQQGFLFHALYAPDDDVYVNQMQCRLQGELNIAALQQTWQLIGDRHPILRTAFVWEDLSQPLQVVHQQVVVPWQVHDWRSQSPEDQKTGLADLLQRERSAGLPTHVAPLMRVTLIRVAETCYDIIWSCHHMLLDGWSMPMVIQEIFNLYDSLSQGKTLAFADRRPYRDYIAWLSAQDLLAAETFWTSLLQGFRSPTSLGYQKVQGMPSNHEIQGLTLNSKTAAAIQTLARQQYLTLNTLIQGAWAVLLSHISGQGDIVFGATTAGRPPTLDGADKMVGLFINTLPVRAQLLPTQEIMTWMQTIQTQQSEARQYEYSPLSQIQRWSEVPAGMSLFDSLIVFENYRVAPVSLSAETTLEIQAAEVSHNNNYPLTLRVLPREELVLEIMSDRTCFAAEITDRWLHYLEALLQWLVAHPDATLGDWQVSLSDIERQWQKKQAQTQAKSNLKKLRKTRRKAVRSSQQEENL